MRGKRPDPVRLEVFHHLLAAFCEEAGTLLQRAAVSPNIRERRDFSVALFDAEGRLVAQAAHIPVHLGSAGDAVAAAREAIAFAPGDVAILNDPYAGGTHLPDVTLVRPVFLGRGKAPSFFLVDRAHHADIGGATPGSMGSAADLIAEGLVIPPVLLRHRGKLVDPVVRLLQRNVRGSADRMLDLQAQESALLALESRLQRFVADQGLAEVRARTDELLDYTERVGAAAVQGLRRGIHRAEDVMEDDGQGNGPFALRLDLHVHDGRVVFDWSRSDAQARGGINANRSVVLAACVYAIRCMCPERLPVNEGLFRLLELRTRPGTVVDPIAPAPVAGGNVETSQRLVDVALAAVAQALPPAARRRLPACSAGTMSNLAIGGTLPDGTQFACYETLPGGAGAGPGGPGQSAIQTHMTNTRNTPLEEMEHRFPVRIRSLTVRRGSGGAGARRGGDGLVKSVEALEPMSLTFLGERHRNGPPGACGGKAGAPGRLLLVHRGKGEVLPSKCAVQLQRGDIVTVLTPGGGGHG